jgi:hypothetical protein
MKKYLLTVFGDFNTDAICREVAISLTPVIDSPNLKFQYTKGVLIFHFASELDIVDIHDFLEMNSDELYESFILSEFTDKVTVFMPEKIVNHLFDLENTTEDASLNINLNTEEFNNEDDTEHDDFVAFLLDGMKKELKPPTLDQLLDKIKSDGIGTLTQFERGILDNYSNN